MNDIPLPDPSIDSPSLIVREHEKGRRGGSIEGFPLPNDEPRIARLAWPDGMAVLVGPMTFGGIHGIVDWSFNPVIPGDRFTSPTTMAQAYGSSMVPVRHHLTCAMHDQRWLVAMGGRR